MMIYSEDGDDSGGGSGDKLDGERNSHKFACTSIDINRKENLNKNRITNMKRFVLHSLCFKKCLTYILTVILTFSMVLFLFDGHNKNFNFEENQEIQQDKSHPEAKIILKEEAVSQYGGRNLLLDKIENSNERRNQNFKNFIFKNERRKSFAENFSPTGSSRILSTKESLEILNSTSFSHLKVKGWPPEKDRNMTLYVRPDTNDIISDLGCMQSELKDIELLIIVQSAPGLYNRRRAIRNTWMSWQKDLGTRIKVVFIMGTEESQTENEGLETLAVEKGSYCDIVQYDYVDDYANVTLDTLYALKFVLTTTNLKPDFVMISDDDAFINLPIIYSKFFQENILTPDSTDLWGYRIQNGTIFRPLKDSPDGLTRKWDVPEYLIQGEHYPDFLSGSGYVLPRATIGCLFSEALRLPYFHINDIFLTGYVREKCGFGLRPAEPTEFQPFENSNMRKLTPTQAVIHYIDPRGMYILNHIFREQNGVLSKDCSIPMTFCLKSKKLHFCDLFGCKKFEKMDAEKSMETITKGWGEREKFFEYAPSTLTENLESIRKSFVKG